MLSRISCLFNSTLNMVEGSGLVESSIRIMGLMALLKLMFVNEGLWTQMMLRVKIEGVLVRVRGNMSWLEMKLLMNSCISRHIRMF